VTVASKPFAESYLLAEVFAQLLEHRGFQVDRRPGLGSTEIIFQAVRAGSVDVYPEYTGTGLVAILGVAPESDPARVLRQVRAEFNARWGAVWLAPLGFQNTYAMAVRRETAERYQLRTLSDLARVAPDLVGGFSPDFIGREDGLPGIRSAYGLRFRETRSLLQAVKYQALATGGVDIIDGYSTDGQIARYDLVVLEDDRRFFPAYQVAPLAGRHLAQEQPEAVAALTELSGLLDETAMRRYNERIEVDGEDVARVAAALLRDLRLAGTDTGVDGVDADVGALARSDAGVTAYMWSRRTELGHLTLRHLLLVGVSLLVAVMIAVPLGLALERAAAGAESAIRVVGLLQTIPSIALLAFMIPLLGIGVMPALVALFLYSLYPILRNTYSGVRDASPAAVDAARALGMTPLQVLGHVRLPLAAPVIMAGIRTAAVITVGTATLAAFIGAGGLGDPIVSGLALSDTNMILSGAIPAASLALLVDLVLHAAERLVTPKGQG
jgi:osmoprotectant transport system permease protein